MFRSPIKINTATTTSIKTPGAFQSTIPDPRIDVLPILNRESRGSSGWCVYAYEHQQAPELEVMCGGVNGKTSRAAAVWRQGHLLHFGFQPSPGRMTETGRSLLLNAIAYISRFTDDRPIVRTRNAAGEYRRIFDRGAIGRLVANPKRDVKILKYYTSEATFNRLTDKSREEIGEWFDQVRGFIHADAEGRLAVDAEAQQFGEPPAEVSFLDKAVAGLGEPARAGSARRLLQRYVPEGPGADASAGRWQAWLKEHRSCLFFSDPGGYRWYVDALAKRRGLPTGKLRSVSRAALPAK